MSVERMEVGNHVLDVPEFAALVDAARQRSEFTVAKPHAAYWLVESATETFIRRVETGLVESIWFGALTAGIVGRLSRFDADPFTLDKAN